jgi:hypothetical protein
MLHITTSAGVMKIRLRPDAAPQTCKFIETLVKAGAYNNCVFYRGEAGFVLQGGLKKADGTQGKGGVPNPPLEFKLPNKRGTVTMARWEDTNSGSGEVTSEHVCASRPSPVNHGTPTLRARRGVLRQPERQPTPGPYRRQRVGAGVRRVG